MPIAIRLAQSILQVHGHEGSFEVSVDRDLIDDVQAELTRLGCTVEAHPFKSMLLVRSPRSDSSASAEQR